MKLSRQQKERLYYAVMESLKPLVIKHLNEDIYRHIDFTPDNDEFYSHNNSTLYMTNGTDFDPLLGPGEEENEPYFKYMKNKAPKKYKSPNWNVSQQAIDRFLYGETKEDKVKRNSEIETIIFNNFATVQSNEKVARNIMNSEGIHYMFFDIKKDTKNILFLIKRIIGKGFKEVTYILETPNSIYIVMSPRIFSIVSTDLNIAQSYPSPKELQTSLGQFAGHSTAEKNNIERLSDITNMFSFGFRIPQSEIYGTLETQNGNTTDELPWLQFRKMYKNVDVDTVKQFIITVNINPDIEYPRAQMFYNNPNTFINKEYKNTVTVERERNSWIITTPTLEDLYNAFH